MKTAKQSIDLEYKGTKKRLNLRTALISLCMFAFVGTSAQTGTVTVKLQNASVKELFSAIEKQTSYRFSYRDAEIKGKGNVTISATNRELKQLLEGELSKLGLKYAVSGNKIIVTPVAAAASAQPKKVTGKVVDANGEPVIGATIKEQGTANGTITDFDGNFTLDVADNAMLEVSYIGYKSQELQAVAGRTLSVTLREDTEVLDEVVVVGYGVQKKKLLTGATVNVSGDNIQKLNTVSPFSALQSQSPGLSITKTSGKPGSGFNINVRGLGTVGNAAPLVIIDNVAGGDLNSLNASDIESIDVLKDAASAAIYGARAANGVILVKTKQGKKGKTNVSYDGYYGIQTVAKYLEVLDAQEYMSIQEEAFRNADSAIPVWENVVPMYDEIKNGWKGTNWQKEFTNKNAPVQSHSLNIVGGSEKSTHSLGISFTSQEGIFGQPQAPLYNRYSFRLNTDYVIYEKGDLDIVKIGENLLYNYIDQSHNSFAAGDRNYNDMRNILNMHPLMTVYDENGDFTKSIPWADAVNPIGNYWLNRGDNEQKTHNLQINPYIEIQPIKNLVIKSSFGFRLSAYSARTYVPAYTLGSSTNSIDKITQDASLGYSYQLENTINYRFDIDKIHNFDVLLGQSIEKQGIGSSVGGSNRGSIFNSFDYAYLSNVKTVLPSNISLYGSPFTKTALSSFFGRINYNYNEKYMLTAIMRADGSSNFAKGNRWGYFPSIAAGWIISNEKFMEPITHVMDYLKLRASWGQNGNQDISPFQYLSTYAFSGGDYYFGADKNVVTTGAYSNIIPNEDVTWETSEQLNIGMDSRFFNSRLGLTLDWYKKTTRDWLVKAPIPMVWGASAPYINGGSVENKGFEVVLSWNDKVGDFTYSVNGNISFNKNKVIEIANSEGIIEGSTTVFSTNDRTSFYRAQVGYPIGYFYGYKTNGVFQTPEQIEEYKGAKLSTASPGDLIFVDTDNNNVIDANDKTMIGDPNPDAIFGFSVNLGYKGFDFSLSANGVAGNQIATNYRNVEQLYGNYPKEYLGRWHGEGTSNRYPKVSVSPDAGSNWGWNSDIYVNDGDYLRIQNITVGYDFKNLLPKLFLSQMRLYFAVNNLFTFTKYYGLDPEIGYSIESWSKGLDLGFYPTPRTYIIGLNLKF